VDQKKRSREGRRKKDEDDQAVVLRVGLERDLSQDRG